jgi:hypothetical protein
LFDLAGKVVSSTSASNQTSVEVNTSALNSGSYIYQVKAGDNVTTGKLIKK